MNEYFHALNQIIKTLLIEQRLIGQLHSPTAVRNPLIVHKYPLESEKIQASPHCLTARSM